MSISIDETLDQAASTVFLHRLDPSHFPPPDVRAGELKEKTWGRHSTCFYMELIIDTVITSKNCESTRIFAVRSLVQKCESHAVLHRRTCTRNTVFIACREKYIKWGSPDPLVCENPCSNTEFSFIRRRCKNSRLCRSFLACLFVLSLLKKIQPAEKVGKGH